MNNIDQLLTENRRLIEQEVRRYSTHVPEAFVRTEAFKLAREAAKEFDPKSGAKFSTFLVNALHKLTRLSTTYGNVVRMPEAKQFKLNKVKKTRDQLAAEKGREPTVEEISDASHIPLAEVSSLLQGRSMTMNLEDSTHQQVFDDTNDEWVHFVYHDLPPRDKLIFEHMTGFNGQKILSGQDLSHKLGVSPTTLSKRVQFIQERIRAGVPNV